MSILKRGCVQVYTGEGKGKTTAAFGLAWRMLGRGGRVYICQFLKPADQITGEAAAAEQWGSNLCFERLDTPWNMVRGAGDFRQMDQMKLAIAAKLGAIGLMMAQGEYDLVILDEIVFCLSIGAVTHEQLNDLFSRRPNHTELVLTGRGADDTLCHVADLVTECRSVKHPYNVGVFARAGIEY